MRPAPDFTLPDQDGALRSLGDYAGRWLVLYFYPEDDTPGCTTEACGFRDGRDELVGAGAVVVGVSHDSVASHRAFAEKYALNFPLLSDETGDVCKAYGAWGVAHAKRKTFLINPGSQIVHEYPAVSPNHHAAQVMKDLLTLRTAH